MNSFSHITGNEHVKDYLVRMVENNAIAHSLLFAGPTGIGKGLFAEAFAKFLLGTTLSTHPDIHNYHPEGKVGMHSIDSMRQFGAEVYLPPYEASWKVFVIHNADRMLTYSANALLKTLEEPAPKSVIILLSSNPEAILPTLLSRCRIIRFHAIRFTQQDDNPLRTLILNALAKGRMSTYTQLMHLSREVSDHVEQTRQQLEETMRTSFKGQYPEGMTSVQQHAIDKELEGALAMRLSDEADKIFDVILSWYRDMHLMHVGGDLKYLFHPDFREQSEQALQRGDLLTLEEVQKSISQAKLSLERSTPFHNCLENLFLQLNLL